MLTNPWSPQWLSKMSGNQQHCNGLMEVLALNLLFLFPWDILTYREKLYFFFSHGHHKPLFFNPCIFLSGTFLFIFLDRISIKLLTHIHIAFYRELIHCFFTPYTCSTSTGSGSASVPFFSLFKVLNKHQAV